MAVWLSELHMLVATRVGKAVRDARSKGRGFFIEASAFAGAFSFPELRMDPTDLGPGTATWLGGTGTVLLGGFLWLRKFLSKDAADRAMDNADIGTVRRLNELLDSEREARKLAEARADQFAKERNDLAATVGRMEGKIEALTSQVANLTERVTLQSDEIARLRIKLGGTT